MRIARIPEAARALLASCPTLETVAVRGTVGEQALRARKPDCFAPYAGEAIGCLGYEILEVAAPAPAVVGKEQELVGVGQQHPTGEMDRANIAEETRPELALRGLGDGPEHEP